MDIFQLGEKILKFIFRFKRLFKLKILNNILKKNNSFIILKHHSNHFKDDLPTGKNKKIQIDKFLSKFSNFINLNYDTDLNTVMCHCDLSISDYLVQLLII